MACDIKLYVQQYKDKPDLRLQKLTLQSGVEEDAPLPTMDDIVTSIMALNPEQKKSLASLLRDARGKNITDDDIKKIVEGKAYHFISNTNIDQLLQKYPSLQVTYSDLQVDPNESYTLIAASKFQLNGTSVYGRLERPNGEVVFIIKDRNGAELFLQYLKTKQFVREHMIDDNKFDDPKYDKYLETLKPIAEKNNKSVRKLILDYIDNIKSVKETKDRIQVDNIIRDIQGRPRKSSLVRQYLEDAAKEYSYNRVVINQKKLFKLIHDNFGEEEGSLEKLTPEELQEKLQELFFTERDLMKVHVASVNTEVKETKKGEQEVYLTQKQIDAIWSHVDFTGSGFDEKDWKLSFNTFIQKDEAHAKYAVDTLNSDYTINDGKVPVKVTAKLEKTASGKFKISAFYKAVPENKETTLVTLTFPWTSLGNLFNYGYTTTALPEPVEKTDSNGMDSDGRYHGYYIYAIKKYDSVKYIASRHLISPGQTGDAFNTLDEAKAEIDKFRLTSNMYDNSLYNLKQYKTSPRTSVLDMSGVVSGQVITTLDIQLPAGKLSNEYFNLAIKNLPAFYEHFKETIPETEELVTPEQAVSFLFLINQKIDHSLPLNEAEVKIHEEAANIISTIILPAKTKSYFVEDIVREKYKGEYTGKKIGYLRELKGENGTDIKLNVEAETRAASIGTLEDSAKFFKDKYGVDIKVLSQQEIEESEIPFKKDFRGCVYDGTIYLNASKADTSDLFHEMAHIILGIIRSKDLDLYLEAIDKIENYGKKDSEKQESRDRFAKTLLYVEQNYKDYAKEDQLEETAVRVLADRLKTNKELSQIIPNFEFFSELIDDLNLLEEAPVDDSFWFNRDEEKINEERMITKTIKSKIEQGVIIKSGC